MKVKVENFGPITKGYNSKDGFMDITKMTVFLGTQGSGKSTIIKLISTFSYIEKALISGKLSTKELTYQRLVNDFFSWHSIENFVKPETLIVYVGEEYMVTFKGDKSKPLIQRQWDGQIEYIRPKICYIPAERNICSAIPKVETLGGMLKNIYAVISDFSEASDFWANQEISLPLKNFRYKYNLSSKRKTVITETGVTIQLNEAASGLQSMIPLAIVNNFYSNPENAFLKRSVVPISNIQKNKLENHIFNTLSQLKLNSIFPVLWNLEKEPDYSFIKTVVMCLGYVEPKSAIAKSKAIKNEEYKKHSVFLKNIIHETVKSCLLSIIEEPEQNLFPNSQKLVLEGLVENSNYNNNNKIILTTHSPYILGSINNCLYAGYLKKRKRKIPKSFEKKYIYPENVSAYYISDGKVRSAVNKDGEFKQINHGLIDLCSKEINSTYEELCNLDFSK